MYDQWIHWNPDRFIMIIPLLDQPLAWYGVLFAFGFGVSSIVGTWLVRHMVLRHALFQENYIKDRNTVVQFFRNCLSENNECEFLLPYLDSETKSQLMNWKPGDEVPDSLTVKLVKSLNAMKSDEGFFKQVLASNRGAEIMTSRLSKGLLKDSKKQPDPAWVRSVNMSLIHDLLADGLHSVRTISENISDKVIIHIAVGTVVGARLGYVIFYNWHHFQYNLLDIPKFWQGGLASHGGVAGVIISLIVFYFRNRKVHDWLRPWALIDIGTLSVGFAFGCIRLGNFFNQEIIGKASDLPWAIVFENPAGGLTAVPRHPIQLYESFFYFTVFFVLLALWKRFGTVWKDGTIFGLANVFYFSGRFFLEFLKVPQSVLIGQDPGLVMGHYLSLPYVLLGVFVLFFLYKR